LLPQGFHRHPRTEWQHNSTSSFSNRNRSLQRQSRTAATKEANPIDNGQHRRLSADETIYPDIGNFKKRDK
jgi:hypothetical protein